MQKKNWQLSSETARAGQILARHQLINKIYLDILADMMVCEIEGWDKFEFIEQLQEVLNFKSPRIINNISKENDYGKL